MKVGRWQMLHVITRKRKIAQVGEKISLRRNEKWSVEGTGAIASYIHMGGKVGVLLELSCEKAESVSKADFQELAKISRCMSQLQLLNIYREMKFHLIKLKTKKIFFGKQLTGKPDNIIDKILVGKVNKYFRKFVFRTRIC